MKQKTWKSKLTAKERRHITESTEHGTLAEFKRNIAHQKANHEHSNGNVMDCWDCRFIAKKLGLWD